MRTYHFDILSDGAAATEVAEAADDGATDSSVGCSSARGGANAALILLAIGSLGFARRRAVR
ncbi:hypothetical protein BH10PSE4_BH10PSE4_36130 [soil metagenome]